MSNKNNRLLATPHRPIVSDFDRILVNAAISLEAIQQKRARELFDLIQRNQVRLSHFLVWPRQVVSIDDTQAFTQTQSANHHSGISKTYCIIYRGAGAGILSFNEIDSANKTATIGYWIDAALEGKGVISAALSKLIECYSQAGIIRKFVINCSVTNKKSNAVARRNGFHCKEVIKQAVQLNGEWIDQNRYERLL